MSILEIINSARESGWALGAILIVASLIKIPKLEVNFWGWIGRKLGQAFGYYTMKKLAEIENKMDKLEQKVDKVESRVGEVSSALDEHKAIEYRARILQAGDELMEGKIFSKDRHKQLLRDCRHYMSYCESHHDFENGVTEPTCELIATKYKERFGIQGI